MEKALLKLKIENALVEAQILQIRFMGGQLTDEELKKGRKAITVKLLKHIAGMEPVHESEVV